MLEVNCNWNLGQNKVISSRKTLNVGRHFCKFTQLVYKSVSFFFLRFRERKRQAMNDKLQ